MNPAIAFPIGSRLLTSVKVVLYTIPTACSNEFYVDRLAALQLARAIDALIPRSDYMSTLYSMCQNMPALQTMGLSFGDIFLDRLVPTLLQPKAARSGRQLFVVNCENLLRSIERQVIEWQVVYQPGEDFDHVCFDIYDLVHPWPSQAPVLMQDPSQSSCLSAMTAPTMTMSSYQMQLPQSQTQKEEPPRQQECDVNPNTQSVSPHLHIASGCTTPAETMLEDSEVERSSLQREIDDLIRDTINVQVPNAGHFPTSVFRSVDSETEQDEKAAKRIIYRMRVLAIDPSRGPKDRFSLLYEKQAINSMSINANLNIGKTERILETIIRRLFIRYDQDDEQDWESFQRALLMVTIRLLRQKTINDPGKKRPGSYANDFDSVYPFPANYIRLTGHLCRIIVACGHPCILVVLVRMAIRNRMTLLALLEELPLDHFCRFLASGRVTDSNKDEHLSHKNLFWLHGNVLLPLLHTASQRVMKQLHLLDGNLVCDEDTCLRSIVPCTKQGKYAHFEAGQLIDPEWARGRVLLQSRALNGQGSSEYSIEKEDRTFHRYQIASYANVEKFADAPSFLQSKTILLRGEL